MTLREIHDLIGAPAKSLEIMEVTDRAPFDALALAGGPNAARLERELLALDQKMSPPAMLIEVCRADRFIPADIEAYADFDEYVDLANL